jgi:hypothetical protein
VLYSWSGRLTNFSHVLVGNCTDVTSVALFAILVRTPDQAQLTNIVPFPCEHFSVAQDTLSGSRFPGGTFGFDHLVDGAAVARNSKVGHGRKHAPVRLRR